MSHVDGFNDKIGFIWSIADLLRGDYRQHEYGQVILPLTVLRRLDCVLEPTNNDLLKMFFDKPEFKEALTAWARREVYKKIQDTLGETA